MARYVTALHEPQLTNLTRRCASALVAIALIAMCWAITGLAQAASVADEPAGRAAEESMVVTGTRLPAGTNPSYVTVIDREEILARAPASVLDLFRSVAGVNVAQAGGRGGASSVFIRGSEPNFTVVLIDGVKVNDPNNSRGGSFDFASLNVAEIERVEILRGAMSSVYGSDALAGVINIITGQATERMQTAISGEFGTDEYARASLQMGAPLGALLGASFDKWGQLSFGVTSIQEGEVIEGNDFSNNTIGGRYSVAAERFGLDLSARYADTEAQAFPDDSGGPEFAVLRDVDTRDQDLLTLAGSLSVRWGSRAEWLIDASYVDHTEEFVSPGVAPGVRDPIPPNRTASTLERLQLATHVVAELSDSTSVSAGIDFTQEDGKSIGAVELFPGFSLPTDFRLERDVTGLFTELAYYNAAGVSLAVALRRDDPEDEGTETTARIGLQYEIDGLRLFSNWGEGYKLPSFFALGHALVGNPDLRPETSVNFEVGVASVLLDGSLDVMLTGFRNEFEDLIDFDADLFMSVNREEVTTQGFELSARYNASDQVQLGAHATYTDVDVNDSSVILRHRPQWRGGMNADWQISKTIKLRLDWVYQGEVFDSSIPTGGVDLDSYNRFDALASWSPSGRLSAWVGVDDLLNENFEEAIGFPSGGTRVRIGIRYAM